MLKSSVVSFCSIIGLRTFRFAYGRTLKPIISMISMISGLLDLSLIPKTNYFYVFETPGYIKWGRCLEAHNGA